jgi:cytochrome P450
MAIDAPPLFPMARMAPLDPPPALAEMQARSPIGRIRLYRGDEAWIVTGYELSRQALRSPALSSDFQSPGYPLVQPGHALSQAGSLTHMDPPEHNVYRRMLAPEFIVKRIEALRPQMSDIVDELFTNMMAVGPGIDLVDALAISVPARVTCLLLGLPYEKRDYFVSCVDQFLGGHTSPDEIRQARGSLRALLLEVIQAKRGSSDEDLLARVVHDYVETGDLEEEQLVGFAELLLVAGFDTTSNMIALGTLTLLNHPDQFAALRDDPSLAVGAVEELLRYLTVPHHGRHRVAVEDFVLDGQTIRAGDGMVVALNIANRDPAHFTDPDSLQLDRADRSHLGFGYGVHQCLGATLARLELQIVFTELAKRMPNAAVAVPLEELDFKDDSAVYGVRELPITW